MNSQRPEAVFRRLCGWRSAAASSPLLWFVLQAAAFGALLLACSGDEAGGPSQPDADVIEGECPGGRVVEGFCTVPGPSPTPMEQCPSGQLGEGGICQPAAPAFADWTCPEGWASVPALTEPYEGVESFSVCRPSDPADCPSGFMPWPGRGDCVRQGLECPAAGERWHDEATIRSRAGGHGGDIVYVCAGAAGRGDGSRAQPYGNIYDALGAARDGDILALSGGDYTELVALSRPMALVGACVEETRIVSPSRSNDPTIELSGRAGVVLSDLTVTGSWRPGIGIRQNTGANLIVSVAVEDAAGFGIGVRESGGLSQLVNVVVRGDEGGAWGLAVADAELEVEGGAFLSNGDQGVVVFTDQGETSVALTDVIVADTRPVSVPWGRGLDVSGGARVTVERGMFLRNHGLGITAWCRPNQYCDPEAATEVDLVDVWVAETQPQSDRIGGSGLWVEAGAHADVTRGTLVGNHDLGVAALGEGTEVHLTDVLVAETQPQVLDGDFGRGLEANQGAIVTLERGVFLRNHGVGIISDVVGTELTLTDILVADTQPKPDGDSGLGLGVVGGSRAVVERGVFLRNHEAAVYALFQGSEVVLRDVLVADTRIGELDPVAGAGLALGRGTMATVERAAFLRNVTLGVGAAGRGTELNLTDVLVADTLPQPVGEQWGLGFDFEDGPNVDIERAAILRNSDVGVLVRGEGTEVQFADVIVADTQAREADGTWGRGFQVEWGARVALERAVLVRNHDTGMAVLVNSTATLRDVLVADTRTVSGSTSPIGGSGVAVVVESELQVSNFQIWNSELAGLVVAREGRVRAEDGLISQNLVGVNVQVPDFDFSSSFIRVRNVDNELDVDFSELPVPGANELDLDFVPD